MTIWYFRCFARSQKILNQTEISSKHLSTFWDKNMTSFLNYVTATYVTNQ